MHSPCAREHRKQIHESRRITVRQHFAVNEARDEILQKRNDMWHVDNQIRQPAEKNPETFGQLFINLCILYNYRANT